MTTNATVDDRHTEQAQHIAGFLWNDRAEWIAQTIANLEAARAESADLTNRLAEIDRIADRLPHQQDEPYNETHRLHYWRDKAIKAAHEIHTLASGHTPSPCLEDTDNGDAPDEITRLKEEVERQEELVTIYRRAQLNAEEKLRRSEDNAKGWKGRAEYLESKIKAPCPSCATKDEAMAERAREVSDACALVVRWFGNYSLGNGETIKTVLSRFIIPPADPVAEALKATLQAYQVVPHGRTYDADPDWPAALAELKSRLGGAK